MSAALALTQPTISHAQPQDIRDLSGARAPGAEMEMQRRGYQDTGMRGGAQYWWNSSTRSCARIVVAQGRYASVTSASASDCKQGGGGGAAAAIAGIAAIGLIAALASHHKDTDNRHKTSDHDSEFERGYHDALYGSDYDNRDSEGYHEGYVAGENERSNRRHANTGYVRNSAPRAALDACSRRADDFQNQPAGSSVPIGVSNLGRGQYEMTMATGRYRSRCTVDDSGRVSAMNPF